MRQTIDDSLKELKLIDMVLTEYGYTKECTPAYLVAILCEQLDMIKELTTFLRHEHFIPIQPRNSSGKINNLLAKFLKEINDADAAR